MDVVALFIIYGGGRGACPSLHVESEVRRLFI